MTPRWSDDDIRAAVAAATSYAAALEHLGSTGSPAAIQRLQQRIRMLGVSTAHFVRTPRRARRKTRWTDDQLRDAVASAQSYSQAIRALGLVPAGGNFVQVQRRIRELALDTSHFLGRAWNVGWKIDPRPRTPLAEVLVAGRWANTHALKKRLFAAGLKEPRCELCGWAERAPDGRIPVELDHISGDTNDNRLVNLRIVCPNCHALQPTHRGLNQQRRKR